MFYETQIIGAAVQPLPSFSEVNQVEQAPAPLAEELRAQIEELKAKIAAQASAQPAQAAPSIQPSQAAVAKNHVPQRPKAGRKYVLQSKSLATWGKVPQQQLDIADILTRHFDVGVSVDEAEVFAKVAEQAPMYPHLATSVQDSTYLLKYYLNLSAKNNHAGLVARGLVQVVG